jgi:2-polyprenyl-3-methyl-5-hydroxy-6-metoxy-1,4-benzoquinol methylase
LPLQRLKNKSRFFLSSLAKTLTGRHNNCPSCGGSPAETLDHKAFVTAFRRCSQCKLLYRTPTSNDQENEAFYQEDYTEGFTTDLPSPSELKKLLESKFADSEKDYTHYLAVLSALGVTPGARVFDYGCSWGYGSHQLASAGYQVDAFEISLPRAAYAQSRLGVSMTPLVELASASYDVFFSAHVIEHVPSVSAFIQTGLRLLKPGGLFIAFTPNGSATFRSRAPCDWHLLWGEVHPQLIDEVFLASQFPKVPLFIHSAPLLQFHHPEHLQPLTTWTRQPGMTGGSLDQIEMVFATQAPPLTPQL